MIEPRCRRTGIQKTNIFSVVHNLIASAHPLRDIKVVVEPKRVIAEHESDLVAVCCKLGLQGIAH